MKCFLENIEILRTAQNVPELSVSLSSPKEERVGVRSLNVSELTLPWFLQDNSHVRKSLAPSPSRLLPTR